MRKKAIGSIMRSLVSEKNFSVDQVAKLIGKSRQQIYNDFNRTNMKDDEIEKYSDALGVEKAFIYELAGGTENESAIGSRDSSYLLVHLANLEDQFKQLLRQLETKDTQIEVKDKQLESKDRQIERLMDLLGKLDLGGKTPWGKVLPLPVEAEQEEEMEAA